MAHRTIMVKHYTVIRKEALNTDAAVILPGTLLDREAAGGVQKAAATTNVNMVAVEDDLQGKEISESYAVGALVQFNIPRAGDEVVLRVANGETISYGERVFRGASGLLEGEASANDEATLVGIALEAVDMSGSDGADPSGLILVEIV